MRSRGSLLHTRALKHRLHSIRTVLSWGLCGYTQLLWDEYTLVLPMKLETLFRNVSSYILTHIPTSFSLQKLSWCYIYLRLEKSYATKHWLATARYWCKWQAQYCTSATGCDRGAQCALSEQPLYLVGLVLSFHYKIAQWNLPMSMCIVRRIVERYLSAHMKIFWRWLWW